MSLFGGDSDTDATSKGFLDTLESDVGTAALVVFGQPVVNALGAGYAVAPDATTDAVNEAAPYVDQAVDDAKTVAHVGGALLATQGVVGELGGAALQNATDGTGAPLNQKAADDASAGLARLKWILIGGAALVGLAVLAPYLSPVLRRL